DVPAGQDVGQATLHHAADVEVVDVEERRQGDAEDLLAVEFLGERLGEELIEPVAGGRGGAAAVRPAAAVKGAGHELPGAGRRVDDAVGDQVHVLRHVEQPRDRHRGVTAA